MSARAIATVAPWSRCCGALSPPHRPQIENGEVRPAW